MTSADIQYLKLVKLLQNMDKRLTKIEAALEKRGKPPKTLHLPQKVNDA